MKIASLRGLILAVVIAGGVVPAFAQDKPLEPGWLSLDSSVGVLDSKIGDAKGSLEKALGIGISGYFDTGWTFSTNHPSRPGNISLRYFDKDHNDLVFNGFNITIDKPEKDWGVGFHLAGDFGRTGELLREATLWGRSLHREPSAELREAFLTTTIPIGAGLGIKGGLFVTPLGTEIIPNPGAFNDNISRSFLFNLAIPFRHLGVLFSYPVHKMVGLSFGVVTGWDNPRDNNNQPSFLGGVSFTPTDKISLVSNLIYGPEQRPNGPKRFTIANVLTIKPIDPLAIALEYTIGHEGKVTSSGRDATWQGMAGIASYSWTDRFTTALRAEWFNDRDGARILGDPVTGHQNVTVGEVTFTGSYKFTKMLMGRAEVRQDWSDRNVFAVGNQLNRTTHVADKSQTTLGLQLVYQY
jgi:hypothetical protein